MTARSRVDRIGRRLGVGAGRRVQCPSCSGSGRVHDVDGEWQFWVTQRRVASIRARLAAERGEPPPEPLTEPEPDEPLQPCWTCRGAGEISEAQFARHDAEGAQMAGWVEERLAAISRYFATSGSGV